MHTTATWRISIFYYSLLIFFPKDLRMDHLIKMMMVMMKTIFYYASYFQVTYRLSKLFLMINSWVWYLFSDERMNVLRRGWVLSARSYKRRIAESTPALVSTPLPLYRGVAESFRQVS